MRLPDVSDVCTTPSSDVVRGTVAHSLISCRDLRYYNEKSHAARVVGGNSRESGDVETSHTRLGFGPILGPTKQLRNSGLAEMKQPQCSRGLAEGLLPTRDAGTEAKFRLLRENDLVKLINEKWGTVRSGRNFYTLLFYQVLKHLPSISGQHCFAGRKY